jgi:hypothetical protein
MPDVVNSTTPEPPAPPTPAWRSPIWMTLAALGLGLSVEILFYGRPLGVSVLIWAGLCILGLLGLAAIDRVRPAREALFLGPAILFLAAMVFVRLEPMTVFLNLLLILVLFALWVRVFRSGGLARYGWLDLGLPLAWVPLEAITRPWRVLGEAWRHLVGERGGRSRLGPVVRGLFLALPLLIVFAVLLSTADLVFSQYLTQVLRWLGLDRLVDFLLRTAVVIVSGIFFLGALAAALQEPGERRYLGEAKPLFPPFLGLTESSIVLGAVDLLFMSFVVVQFAYLFGGQANVTAAGFTYSEYARRGFGELVAVSALTMGMILGLATWTRRQDRRSRAVFNTLSTILVALVGAILASALMRLLLYEGAYGFTRLRTYTHVAILWMGLMFLVFLGLLLANRLRQFTMAAVVGVVGFVGSLSLLNVDVFIVRQNVERVAASGEVDAAYMASLSYDAAPELVRLAQSAPEEVRLQLLPQLACQQAQLADRRANVGWPAYHLSIAAAQSAFASIADLLAPYPVRRVQTTDYGPAWQEWVMLANGKETNCGMGTAD